jgi:hypothetical protein
MRAICLTALVWLVCLGCSERKVDAPSSTPAIQSTHFGVVETELSPAILVHSGFKYLALFANSNAPAYIAFTTRNGPRSFKRGEKLKADELEECWLLLWSSNLPPWVVYLQRKPLAMTLDASALHLSFANGAGDVVLLPLHGSSTNVDTAKWPEFLTREPLLRIRYWASVVREFPIECHNLFTISNQFISVHQKFRFHSIRDDWNTKPLKLAPMSPPLALAADEKLKRELKDFKMPILHGSYMGFEGVAEWTATFALPAGFHTNGIAPSSWDDFGAFLLPAAVTTAASTSLIHPIRTDGWPRIAGVGSIRPSRDQPPGAPKATLLSPNSRLVTYD